MASSVSLRRCSLPFSILLASFSANSCVSSARSSASSAASWARFLAAFSASFCASLLLFSLGLSSATAAGTARARTSSQVPFMGSLRGRSGFPIPLKHRFRAPPPVSSHKPWRLARLLSLDHGVAVRLPRPEPAEEGADAGEARLPELQRRTGAGGFGPSRTVGDDGLLGGLQLVEVLLDLGERGRDRSRDVAALVGVGGADVDHQHLVRLHQLLELFLSDARDRLVRRGGRRGRGGARCRFRRRLPPCPRPKRGRR